MSLAMVGNEVKDEDSGHAGRRKNNQKDFFLLKELLKTEILELDFT